MAYLSGRYFPAWGSVSVRVSQFFNRSLRDLAQDSDFSSIQLAQRAGLLRPHDSGRYHWLPLGVAALAQIEALLGQLLPGQPVRTVTPGWSDMLTLGEHVLRSYKQLPQAITTNHRQISPLSTRGGLLRLREYTVWRWVNFLGDSAAVENQQVEVNERLQTLFHQLDWPIRAIAGLDDGYSYLWPHPQGEDYFVQCGACGYQATQAHAEFRHPRVTNPTPIDAPLLKVATPDCKTIKAVADFVGVPTTHTLKAVFFTHTPLNHPARLVFVVIRGDLEVNEAKLWRVLGAEGQLRPATEAEIRSVGTEPGYASPVGLDDRVQVVADVSVNPSVAYVAGANDSGYHYTGAVPGRDFSLGLQADIALAEDGSACTQCDSGTLRLETAIELGYSARLTGRTQASFLDNNGKPQPLQTLAVCFGLEHLLMTALEINQDSHGIIWPLVFAPFMVKLIVLGKADDTRQQAETIYTQLQQAGIRVLFDDRNESPGVKFTDADLIGLPLRITVSDRALQQGGVEVSRRTDKIKTIVPLTDVITWIQTQG
jgi:prolyl-tRNA synthetase